MNSQSTDLSDTPGGLASGTWRLDPARSSVEFHVPHFYGLMTVKGRFDSYHGSLDLSGHPAVDLVIDADSLNTKQKQRNKHLRSGHFFDVSNHPRVSFEADTATLDGKWERRSDLAPLRRSQLAPPPSDLQPTVRCLWRSSGRWRKEWDHVWRRSSRSGGTGIGMPCRSGRWRSVMVFIAVRCVRRWRRRCRPSSGHRLAGRHRSWARIGS